MRPDKLLRLLLIPLLLSAPVARADKLPAGYFGRWDVTLHTPERDLPTWLEIVPLDNGKPSVRMVGRWGHARFLPSAEFTGGKLRFVSPKEEEGRKDDMVFTATLDGRSLVGETTGPDGTVWKFRGERAPALVYKGAPAWGQTLSLFNGTDLAGWHLSDPKAAQSIHGWFQRRGIARGRIRPAAQAHVHRCDR